MPISFANDESMFNSVLKSSILDQEQRALARSLTAKATFQKDSKDRLVIGFGYDINSRTASTVAAELASVEAIPGTQYLIDLPS